MEATVNSLLGDCLADSCRREQRTKTAEAPGPCYRRHMIGIDVHLWQYTAIDGHKG
jgi:hypothetical protein